MRQPEGQRPQHLGLALDDEVIADGHGLLGAGRRDARHIRSSCRDGRDRPLLAVEVRRGRCTADIGDGPHVLLPRGADSGELRHRAGDLHAGPLLAVEVGDLCGPGQGVTDGPGVLARRRSRCDQVAGAELLRLGVREARSLQALDEGKLRAPAREFGPDQPRPRLRARPRWP